MATAPQWTAQPTPATASKTPVGGVRMQPMVGGTDVSAYAPMPITPGSATFAAPSGATTITAGGAAQVLAAAGSVAGGIYVQNPLSSADQNIATAEPLVISIAGVAGGYPGQSIKLQPGDDVTIALPPTGAVYVEAPSTGHAFSAFVW
jgi:hypothetical protein